MLFGGVFFLVFGALARKQFGFIFRSQPSKTGKFFSVAARARRTSARVLRRGGAVAAKSAERGLRVYDHRDGPHTRFVWWSAAPGPRREVKHSKRSSLSRWRFIVSTASVLLGVLSLFRAVNFCICPCVLASSECSRMGGPGPRSSDRIF